jgi:polysaccharide biosynthesis/export protein VpsN
MSMKHVGKWLRCWGIVCGLILGTFYVAGCKTQPSEQRFAEVPSALTTTSAPATAPATVSVPALIATPAASPALTNSSDLIPELFRVGDSITITFTDTPNPMPPFEEKIKEDGTITLLQNQLFKAAGMTPGELAKEIRRRYVPDYYKHMTVTVKQQESTRWYYVDGEVKAVNRYIYNNRITVLKAIASAGGFTDFANKKKVKLTRVDGRTQTVNCVKALDNPGLDPEVYPGDKIHVPRSIW